MRNIQNMSIEELLANNGFKSVGNELVRIDNVSSTKCANCGTSDASSLKTMSVTCPTITIPTQLTAPVAGVTVTYLSHSESIDSSTGWKDNTNIAYTTGDGWGTQPSMSIYRDGIEVVAVSRSPNTTTNYLHSVPSTGADYAICVGVADTPDVKCTTYTSSIVAASITCTNAPTPTAPSLSEIDIDFTWTNTGGASASFTPKAVINGGTYTNLSKTLEASPVTLAPGATYNTITHGTHKLTGLTLSAGTAYTVCPDPN